MATTYENIIKELRAKQYRPIYLLYGDEPYYIDKVCDFIDQNALTAAEKVFNYSKVSGRDMSAVEVSHLAGEYPMNSERRLVIVRDAQALHKGTKKDIAELAKYAQHLLESTILVLCYNSADYRDTPAALAKAVEKAGGAAMESKTIYESKVVGWITSHVSSRRLKIEPAAAQMLTEFVGTNLKGIEQAVEKICVAAGEGLQTITAQMVQDNVGISVEYNNFSLRAALYNRQTAKCNRIVKEFSRNEKDHPLQAIIPFLYGSFQKVMVFHYVAMTGKKPDDIAVDLGERPGYGFQMNFMPAVGNYSAAQCFRILDMLRQCDARSKGYAYPAVPYGDFLSEMVFKILNL